MLKRICLSIGIFATGFGVFIIFRLFEIEIVRIGEIDGYCSACFVGLILTLLSTLILLTKIRSIKPVYILLLLWFGLSITDCVNVVIYLLVGIEDLYKGGYPILVCCLAGILTGYGIYKIKNVGLKIIIFVSAFAAVTWLGHCGYNYYLCESIVERIFR